MRAVRLTALAALALAWISYLLPATAIGTVPYRIREDRGGSVDLYRVLYAELARSGRPVIIDGVCNSACTLVLAYVPRDRVCATGRAVMMFHAAFYLDSGATAWGETVRMLADYPAPLRAWIVRNGGLKPQPLTLYGRDLAAIVRACM